MVKVYQSIVDPKIGDCSRAALCSLFNISDKDKVQSVANFAETANFGLFIDEFLKSQGYYLDRILYNYRLDELKRPKYYCFNDNDMDYRYRITLRTLSRLESVGGYFFASVFSPNYFDFTEFDYHNHSVLIDKKCNIVHDPNPEYKDIKRYPFANLIGFNGIRTVWIIKKLK